MRRVAAALFLVATIATPAIAGNEAGEYDAITGSYSFTSLAQQYGRFAAQAEFCGADFASVQQTVLTFLSALPTDLAVAEEEMDMFHRKYYAEIARQIDDLGAAGAGREASGCSPAQLEYYTQYFSKTFEGAKTSIPESYEAYLERVRLDRCC